MDATYKRWINSKEPGQTSFATTTCLDFAHLFSREEMRTRMVISLISQCIKNDANLRCFVVMSNHLHFIATPSPDQTISYLVQQIKRASAVELGPRLLKNERDQLSPQIGLNNHRFWRKGFRGNPMHSEKVIHQKINYIYANPVRAGIVTDPDEYLWSSSHLSNVDLRSLDGLELKSALDYYEKLF